MKGTHHFVQCSEHLEYKYAIPADAANPWASYKNDPTLAVFPALCKNDMTYFPLRRSNHEMLDDNQKYYIRALDCKLKDGGYEDLKEWGPEADFDAYCIDLERGDPKPQIRVHGAAFFNITNFA